VAVRVPESEAVLGRDPSKRRGENKLSPRGVSTITMPGRHGDGGGLYLVVDPNGARRWVFIYRWKANRAAKGAGKLREMGLGPFSGVSLAKAREKAKAQRELLADGLDPITVKHEAQEIPTFGALAALVIEAKTKELRNAKSVTRWERALNTYAAELTEIQVSEITVAHVLKVLKPLWERVPESAQKTRGYIEAVLDAAKAKGFRKGDNPARWRGHLDHLLPKRAKLSRGHHAAMAYGDLPTFIGELRQRDALAALALEFTILTAARTGEVLGATWAEIDLTTKVWTIPKERMKAAREHRVPLGDRAIKILEKAKLLRRKDDLLWPAAAEGKALSNMAMAMLLNRRMGRDSVTVHGFRSSFRDWAGNATNFPRELAEAALAHAIGDDTERAYRRDDAVARRRKLMDAWAAYCEPRGASNVRPLTRNATQ
jgi:integrase